MSDELAVLVRMANQIAANYGYLTGDAAARAVASHLQKFWTPDMRERFLAGSADGLDPVAADARDLLAA